MNRYTLMAVIASLSVSFSVHANCPSNLPEIQGLPEERLWEENSVASRSWSYLLRALGEEDRRVSLLYLHEEAAKSLDLLIESLTTSLKDTPVQNAVRERLPGIRSKARDLNRFGTVLSLEELSCLGKDQRQDFLSEDVNESLRALELDGAVQAGLVSEATVLAEFAKIAKYEENLWGDTILEGDYALTDRASAESIEVLVIGSTVYGYRAVIRADALMTSDCEYNEETEKWNDDCASGYIYVSHTYDAKFEQVPDDNYAEFDN